LNGSRLSPFRFFGSADIAPRPGRFAVQPVPGPVDAFAEYLRKDSAKWGEVIKAANVKIE
jgi:hypothetical protein